MDKIDTYRLGKAFSALEGLLDKTHKEFEAKTYDNSNTKYYHDIEKRLVADKVYPHGVFDDVPVFRLTGRVSAKQTYNNRDSNCGDAYSINISRERDPLGFPVWAVYEKFNTQGLGPEIAPPAELGHLVAKRYFLSNAVALAHKRGDDASNLLSKDIKVESNDTDMPLMMTRLRDNSEGKKKLSSLLIDAYKAIKNQYTKRKEQHEEWILDKYFQERKDDKKYDDDKIAVEVEMRGNDVACGYYPSYYVNHIQGGSMFMARVQVNPINDESFFPALEGFKVERYIDSTCSAPKSIQHLKVIATTKDAKEADLIAHEHALDLAYKIAKDIGLSITHVEDRSESDIAKLITNLKKYQHEDDKEEHLRDHLGISLLDKFHKDFRKYL